MSENRFAMVSKWMPNGDINQFVKAHEGVNRFELVSCGSNSYSLRFTLTIEQLS
jgi:hypothetical protein